MIPAGPDRTCSNTAGVPGYDADAWFGLFVPAATSKDIIARLEVMTALQAEDMRERLRSFGATAGSGTPEQFNALFRNALAKWAKVVRAAGVRVD
jgi:tripartite-type tricarboxylate transporter receptor subunit TctC